VLVLALPLLAGRLGGFTFCPTAGLFGVPCPGCGLTRAALAAAHGHFAEALHWHPLVFLVVPVFGAYLGATAFGIQSLVQSERAQRWGAAAGVGVAVLLFAVWLARFAGAFGGPVPVDPWLF
jgi:hypothetical protein